tara:strand:+ start:19669 stop:19824 length:156 start_codon:yes stop_codon:yes gene_type:complete
MSKNQTISAQILTELSNGLSVKEAINKVLGEGTHEKISGDIWEALQPAKAH